MLVEKEVIRPGTYFYRDETTGLPRKLVVTPELTKYWAEQGSAMLSAGLTIPVPCEHDFNAHPMTPADKLKNNAGWVKEFRLKGDKGDRLFSVVDVPDPEIAKKLPHTIRWTSPWINSFTDGAGKTWNNVISHLALTTRPRIINQQPFGSIAAALSMAQEIKATGAELGRTEKGFCLSRAGRLFTDKKKRERARYPMAFSMWSGGIKLGDDDAPPKADDLPDDDADKGDDTFDVTNDDNDDSEASNAPAQASDMNPLADAGSDVKMEELLCDLLQALGVPMPDESNENEFKRHLYEAAMSKIKELTSKGMGSGDNNAPDQNQPPTQQPNASQPAQNPLIQQEQQPMYMSLEEINKLQEPLKGFALSVYNDRLAADAKVAAAEKTIKSLTDAKLSEAKQARAQRVAIISRVSPKVKADLDAMLALPAMALSMGDGGVVVDPMAQTLAILEKGLADMPRLMTTPASALSVADHPTDATTLTEEKEDEIADGFSRMMGAPAAKKTA